jgi:hypothetical protein
MQATPRIPARLASIVLASCLAACAANPATGVAASGRPLRVQYSTGTGTYVSQDQTGVDVETSSSGNEKVTEHYTAVEHTFQWNDLKYFQGRQELDEQDYFRIAGDDAAVRQIRDTRSSASLKMKIGAPLMVIGLAAGLVLGSVGNPSQKAIGSLGGTLVGGGGALVFYWGHKEMTNRHHLPGSRAEELADVVENCNEGHCTRQPGGRRASSVRGHR